MEAFGVIIEDVQLANIDFSESYEHAAELAATAQAKVVQARQELEKAKVDAQVQVAQAEAAALATKAKADAEAYRVKAEGDALAAAISARGQALSSNPGYLELFRLERWQGHVPTSMIPGATVPFINLGK
jgi:regulator of protease activity HflC (stomatin/prohibitin superfamily)